MTANKRGDWRRVTRAQPCKVCGRGDWCTFQGPPDNPDVVCCMRTESKKAMKNGGWLHVLRPDDSLRQPRRRTVRTVATKPIERPVRDFGGFARQCHLAVTHDGLRRFGDSLGLSVDSLKRLLVGWSFQHKAWTWPMRNAAGEVVGIRLRKPDGRKLSVRGGKEGLFLPAGLQPGGRLLIAEGPTDTASVLDLGFRVIGRPSCSGGVAQLVALVKRLRPAEVVVVSDNDPPDDRGRRPGQEGADALAVTLAGYVPDVRIITPPADKKDARAWKAAGGTAGDVLAAIAAAEPVRLRIQSKVKAGVRNGRRQRIAD